MLPLSVTVMVKSPRHTGNVLSLLLPEAEPAFLAEPHNTHTVKAAVAKIKITQSLLPRPTNPSICVRYIFLASPIL